MRRVQSKIFELSHGRRIFNAFNCMDSLLRLYGFDTYKGFYHKLFFQRKSLACDVMEPFRCVIDKQILKAFNLGQIDEKILRW